MQKAIKYNEKADMYPYPLYFTLDKLYEFLFSSLQHTAAVKITSVEEFNAVSVESCNTPMTKPTPITCAAISLGIPNKLQANGINNNDPPATPGSTTSTNTSHYT